MRYRFDHFELDTAQFTLRVGGGIVHVEPMVFDLLRFLVERAGQVVTRDAIIDGVWAGRIVSDATVASCVKSARKALGDDGQQQSYIRTVRARGFQLVATITSEPADTAIATVAETVIATIDDTVGVTDLSPPKIAVLPLFPLSLDPQLALLGDGIAQEVILELSRLHWLFVVARGSSFKFRGQDVDLERAGAILGAEYFLTGTIMQQGDHCAIAVELGRSGSNDVIWAERFTIPTAELMHMRSTLAGQIVNALEPRIQHAAAIKTAHVPTESLGAWAAYHRAIAHMFRFSKHDNAAATQLLSRAIAIDPKFARAHAGLSFTHFQNAFLAFTGDAEGDRRLARHHAERSLALDPLDPFVNLTMGRSEWLAGNLEASLPWMERAISLSPNYAFAIYNSALIGTFLGEGEANETKVVRAITLSPIDPLNYAMLATRAMTHSVRGNHATAAEWAERAVRAPNAHVQICAVAAYALEMGGNRQQALFYVDKVRRLVPAYDRHEFLRWFPFRDATLRRQVEEALRRLGL